MKLFSQVKGTKNKTLNDLIQEARGTAEKIFKPYLRALAFAKIHITLLF